MKAYEILVFDEDRDYVDALVRFLMSQRIDGNSSISVTGITCVEELSQINRKFSIGIVSEKLLKYLKSQDGPGDIVDKLFTLDEDSQSDNTNSIYKYQSMDVLMGIISQENRRRCTGRTQNNGIETWGIYSPSKHELSMPYALSLCKSFLGEKEVIFVDLSEIGILSYLMGEKLKVDLIDVIYMLENGESGGGIDKYIIPYEGISILSPVATPSQLAYITPAQWEKLFTQIKESGFQKIVVLFGSLIQGFAEIAGSLSKLIILKKPGDFYGISDEVFMDYMEKLELRDVCEDVVLPLSAANLTHGGFRLDALINGKLLEFVNRMGDKEFGKLQSAQ